MTDVCECACGRPAAEGSRYATRACRQRVYHQRLTAATGATDLDRARAIRRAHRETGPVERLLAELAAEAPVAARVCDPPRSEVSDAQERRWTERAPWSGVVGRHH